MDRMNKSDILRSPFFLLGNLGGIASSKLRFSIFSLAVLLIFPCPQFFALDDSSWAPVGMGLNSIVYSVAVDKFGNVYAGGAFTSAGQVQASKVANWNGSDWFPLADGLNGTVFCLFASKDGSLYAGGEFTYSGTTSVNHIAKWNGSNWAPLDSGINYTVYAITEDSVGNLYVGGSFTSAGGQQTNYVAKWDGSAWFPLGTGMNAPVFTLASDSENNIFAGGSFTFAGGLPAQRIAKWNGVSWGAIGDGLNAQVNHICIDKSGHLYVCGSFTYAGGSDAAMIAKWNNSSWSKLGSGLNDEAYCLASDLNGNIYAGGIFTYAGGIPALRVAGWNSDTWSGLGSGIGGFMANPSVYSICVSPDGNLYAGGDFSSAGGKTAAYVAQCAIPKQLVFQTDGTQGATIEGQTTQTVPNGSNSTPVTAKAPEGAYFSNWTASGTPFSVDNPLTVTNVQKNMTLTANFLGNLYTVSFQTDGTGGASISGVNPQYVRHGSDCSSVTAVPPSGYSFSKWLLNGLEYSLDNPLTVENVSGNMTLTAQFSSLNYAVKFETDGSIGASLEGNTNQSVTHGASCSPVSAIAPSTHHFLKWTKNGADYSTANPLTVQNVTQSMTLVANFAINTYTLTYIAGANGKVSLLDQSDLSDPSDSSDLSDPVSEIIQTVEHGASGMPVQAIPDAGYHFVDWSDGNSNNPRTDSNVTADLSVTANFAINTYTLTYSAGANGKVSLPDQSDLSDPSDSSDLSDPVSEIIQTVEYGASGKPVQAIPDTGYHFIDWSDGNASNPRTDSNVTANLSVTANFAINTYTLTYTAGANGKVSLLDQSDLSDPSDSSDLSDPVSEIIQTVEHGASTKPVQAIPYTGYHFIDWSDGNTSNPRTDSNVTANLSVTANFTANVYAVNFVTDGTPGALLSGELSQSVQHGANCSAVSVSVPDNYYFTSWTSGSDGLSVANPFTAQNIQQNMTIVANFTDIPAGQIVVVYFAPSGKGRIEGEKLQKIAVGGNCTQVSAVNETGYHFVDWSDGKTETTRTDTGLPASTTFSANFAINTYTLTYSAGANGKVSLLDQSDLSDPSDSSDFSDPVSEIIQTVEHGASGKPVQAVPDTGYHFVAWSDGNTSNPRTDSNVTANLSVTANFAINTYTLTYTAGVNGKVSLLDQSDLSDPSNSSDLSDPVSEIIQTVEHGASGKPVQAVPDTGHSFVAWSDGSTENPRTDLNVTANISVTANFSVSTYTLTYTAGANGKVSLLEQADLSDPSDSSDLSDPVSEIIQTIEHGASGKPVQAVPDTGYHFVGWSDGNASNPRTDSNVTANLSVTANFAIDRFTVTFIAGGGGTISGTNPQTVDYGSSTTPVSAVPDFEQSFENWTYAGGAEYSKSETISVENIVSDTQLTANFKVRPQFVYRVDFASGENGVVSGNTMQILDAGQNTASVKAVPSDGFIFSEWKIAGAGTFTDNPLVIKNLQKDMSLTALFAQKPAGAFDIVFTSSENGALEGNLEQSVLPAASGSPVTGIPSPGFRLDVWNSDTGAEYSKENPLSVLNPDKNLSLKAEFILAEAMSFGKASVKTTRNESSSSVRDRYSFSAKMTLPESFNWDSGEDTQFFISLGKYVVFAAALSDAQKKGYKLETISERGSATFIQYDSTGKKKLRKIVLKWGKKRVFEVSVQGTPLPNSGTNILNLTTAKTDSKGKIIEEIRFDAQFVFGNASSGAIQMTLTGTKRHKFDKSGLIYYSWNAGASLKASE